VGGKEEARMPLYLDHHKNLEGLTAEAVAEDHMKDLGQRVATLVSANAGVGRPHGLLVDAETGGL
jgi:hypothetical protein